LQRGEAYARILNAPVQCNVITLYSQGYIWFDGMVNALEVSRNLSIPRFNTYVQECGQDIDAALALYQWNMEISSAFMIPLHVFEVVVRNAVVEAIENVHGHGWAWNQGFIKSLPSASSGYNPSLNMLQTARKHSTTGKVVAELNFIFWQKMFTKRHDVRIWQPHLHSAFPYMAFHNCAVSRKNIHDKIEQVRKLRNRIAHHEPIFHRNLAEDYDVMRDIIEWRSPDTAQWMHDRQQVSKLLTQNRKI
jgi:hypothetical protein